MKQGIFTEEGRGIFDPLTTRTYLVNSARAIRDPFPSNIVPSSALNAVSAFFTKNLYPDPTGPGFISNYGNVGEG